MNYIMEYIDQGKDILLFIFALVILFAANRSYLSTLAIVREVNREDVIYEQYNVNPDNTVTKGELIAILLNRPEYEIEIDGILIGKDEDTSNKILTYDIAHEKYSQNYIYDSKYNTIRIIFTGL
jgi:type II secretory pathway component PulC